MGATPLDTSKTFNLKYNFDTIENCIVTLTENTTGFPNVSDIIIRFLHETDLKYDWVRAGCYDTESNDKFELHPEYDNGIPIGIQQLLDKL